jgi:hypothetical protein
MSFKGGRGSMMVFDVVVPNLITLGMLPQAKLSVIWGNIIIMRI